MLMKNKKVFYIVVAGAFLGMGFTMPSCPGQKAMQQQIDSLQQNQNQMSQKIQMLDNELKTATANEASTKQTVDQLTGALGAQKTAIDGLTTSVQQIDTKLTALHPVRKTRGRIIRTSGRRRRVIRHHR